MPGLCFVERLVISHSIFLLVIGKLKCSFFSCVSFNNLCQLRYLSLSSIILGVGFFTEFSYIPFIFCQIGDDTSFITDFGICTFSLFLVCLGEDLSIVLIINSSNSSPFFLDLLPMWS